MKYAAPPIKPSACGIIVKTGKDLEIEYPCEAKMEDGSMIIMDS